MTIKLLMGVGLLAMTVAALPSSRLHRWGQQIGKVAMVILLFAILALAAYGMVSPEHVSWVTGPPMTELITRLTIEAQEQPLALWMLLAAAAILVLVLNSLRREDDVRSTRRIDATLKRDSQAASVRGGQAAMRSVLTSQAPVAGNTGTVQRSGLRIDELLPRHHTTHGS